MFEEKSSNDMGYHEMRYMEHIFPYHNRESKCIRCGMKFGDYLDFYMAALEDVVPCKGAPGDQPPKILDYSFPDKNKLEKFK